MMSTSVVSVLVHVRCNVFHHRFLRVVLAAMGEGFAAFALAATLLLFLAAGLAALAGLPRVARVSLGAAGLARAGTGFFPFLEAAAAGLLAADLTGLAARPPRVAFLPTGAAGAAVALAPRLGLGEGAALGAGFTGLAALPLAERLPLGDATGVGVGLAAAFLRPPTAAFLAGGSSAGGGLAALFAAFLGAGLAGLAGAEAGLLPRAGLAGLAGLATFLAAAAFLARLATFLAAVAFLAGLVTFLAAAVVAFLAGGAGLTLTTLAGLAAFLPADLPPRLGVAGTARAGSGAAALPRRPTAAFLAGGWADEVGLAARFTPRLGAGLAGLAGLAAAFLPRETRPLGLGGEEGTGAAFSTATFLPLEAAAPFPRVGDLGLAGDADAAPFLPDLVDLAALGEGVAASWTAGVFAGEVFLALLRPRATGLAGDAGDAANFLPDLVGLAALGEGAAVTAAGSGGVGVLAAAGFFAGEVFLALLRPPRATAAGLGEAAAAAPFPRVAFLAGAATS